MILTVKISIEKSQENLLAVLKALEAYDVESTAWEEKAKPAPVVPSSDGDRSAALSAAVTRARQNNP